MSRQRYPEKFKIEAVKQETEKGKPVAAVAQRLGMSVHSLYTWIKLYSKLEVSIYNDGLVYVRPRVLKACMARRCAAAAL